jgi:hypothetical protein
MFRSSLALANSGTLRRRSAGGQLAQINFAQGTASRECAGIFAASLPAPPSDGGFAKAPPWVPRMWHGCDVRVWLALLARNRFAVHPRYWVIAAFATFTTLTNTILGLIESAIFGRAVRRTRIGEPPIFLIGHWRTGTTLLHELMGCDERLACPTTYQCMEPCHFLLTERLLSRWLGLLLPANRQMDNMNQAFDRPQEDEFALCMLGAGSPYSAIAFPNRPPREENYLDFEGVPPERRRRWQAIFYWFLQKLTYKHRKRLVLKSPPHTARIGILNEMFPGAVFIHLGRDPYLVFASTLNLWRTLERGHGLQTPAYDGLEERVLSSFERMYEKLEEARSLLGPGQLYELRYEDLVRDPAGELKKIYRYFQFPGFDACMPKLEEYLATIATYKTNQYCLSDEQRHLVARRWGDVIRRYGYGNSASPGDPARPA